MFIVLKKCMEVKMIKSKQWIILFLLAVITCGLYAYNYAEALQKAIYFYECQVSGPKPSWNRVEWRGDSCMDDAVTGGWYDAGDHVKFGLPMAYSASMLGWAAYEYKSAIQAAGQWTALSNNLTYVLDYFVKCHKGSSLVYQIGDGGADHSWWGPVEVIHKKATPGKRPSYSTTASCVTAQTAAALAIGSIVLGNSTYRTHAESLFNTAYSTKSDSGYTAANGFYDSWSGFWDELMWAATWLYIATNNNTYLTRAEECVSHLGREGQSDYIKYKWGHCWDDVHYGAMVLLARLTNKQEYKDFVQMHLDWWTVGFNGEKIATTPKGLAWLDQWGSLRHATATAAIAFVYGDWITDTTLKNRYLNFARSQVDYALGNNEANRSYVVGYGTNPPQHPHHRTAHGSWSDQQSVPPNHRHTIYGALVGGPNQSGGYTDDISNYQTNEVACDYNAGFVQCLAKMCALNGGTPLAGFPAPETKDDEFFTEASLNSTGSTYTEIKALINNRSGWPARLIQNLNFNYYFDASEVIAAGYTVNDLTVSTNYVEFPVTLSAIKQYSGNIYYINIAFKDGTSIFPGGQSEYAGEVQFRIAAPTGTGFWDAGNDFSAKGLTSTVAKTANIPVYDGTTRLFGNEPGNTGTPVPTPTRTSTPQGTTGSGLKGDVNNDNQITIIDALMTAQYSVGLNPAGFIASRADVNCDSSINIVDALMIAQRYVGLIGNFPC